MFNFENPDVGRKAIEFIDSVYPIMNPFQERFGLTNQMRRTAISHSADFHSTNNS